MLSPLHRKELEFIYLFFKMQVGNLENLIDHDLSTEPEEGTENFFIVLFIVLSWQTKVVRSQEFDLTFQGFTLLHGCLFFL